jgi:hypothetical protein
MLNFALNNALQGLSQTLVSLAGPQVEKDNAWTSGGMQNIVHEQYIASGGFGDVHKVSACNMFADVSQDAKSKDRRGFNKSKGLS